LINFVTKVIYSLISYILFLLYKFLVLCFFPISEFLTKVETIHCPGGTLINGLSISVSNTLSWPDMRTTSDKTKTPFSVCIFCKTINNNKSNNNNNSLSNNNEDESLVYQVCISQGTSSCFGGLKLIRRILSKSKQPLRNRSQKILGKVNLDSSLVFFFTYLEVRNLTFLRWNLKVKKIHNLYLKVNKQWKIPTICFPEILSQT